MCNKIKGINEKGSIVTYILAAIFLSGLLVAVLSQGSNKSADSSHVEKEVSYLKADIDSIHYAVAECIQVYYQRVDVNNDGTIDATDNPNPPFPLYDDLSNSGSGEDLKKIKCPGDPSSNNINDNYIFSENLYNSVKVLSNSSLYNVKYFNDSIEGVYLKISSLNSDDIWKEGISRINDMFSGCTVEIITDEGECKGQCLFYWIARPSTSVLGEENDCP